VSRRKRVALLIIGPLLWVGGGILVAIAVHHGDAIEIGLVVLAAALLLAFVTLLPMRRRRLRDERES
jgi:membrane protein implicated in regulation of membrane protease activity